MDISERTPVTRWRFLYAVGSDLVYLLWHRLPTSLVRRALIVRVASSLGPRRRTVFLLLHLRHVSFIEVAARTGLSLERVYQLNQSGIGSVRRRLSFHGVELWPRGGA